MMKKPVFYFLTLFVALFSFMAWTQLVMAAEDTQKHPSCKHCGMDREKFAHSRMLIRYDDGTEVGACSIHCVAIDLAGTIDKTPKEVLVADYGTKELIDAEKATWVLGGAKPGVMTARAKWAFLNKEDAERFIRENGGSLASYDQALKAAYEDMRSDSEMVREKRKMKKSQEHKHP
ncbi:MAG: NosL family protein [Syntrophobacteraceae bacterium]|nr:NosL family protein [Syntrophobacteraceae bacterium]